MTGLQRHPLIVRFFPGFPGLASARAEEPPPRHPTMQVGLSRYFSEIFDFVRPFQHWGGFYTHSGCLSRQPFCPKTGTGITIPRLCRVLLGSEPAFAGQGPTRQIPPWPKPIASMSRDRALFSGCWLRTEVQHREHSRATVLYHRVRGMGREKLILAFGCNVTVT